MGQRRGTGASAGWLPHARARQDPGDPKKLIFEVRVPKHLRGLGEKAFRLESPEEELGRKIRLAIAVDGVSKTWTLPLPLAKHRDSTIKSNLIWILSIDGASQSPFQRCRLHLFAVQVARGKGVPSAWCVLPSV